MTIRTAVKSMIVVFTLSAGAAFAATAGQATSSWTPRSSGGEPDCAAARTVDPWKPAGGGPFDHQSSDARFDSEPHSERCDDPTFRELVREFENISG